MRRALGLTPVNRIEDLESEFAAIGEAARATESAYYEVVDRMRQNAENLERFAGSDRSLSSMERQDELHRAAASVFQSNTVPRPRGAREVDSSNILPHRLRARN